MLTKIEKRYVMQASQISEEIVAKIRKIVREDAFAKKHLYSDPPQTPTGRSAYHNVHSHELVEWTEDGHDYAASFTTWCGRDLIFPQGSYWEDGAPVSIRVIKRSLKRIETAKKLLAEAIDEAQEEVEEQEYNAYELYDTFLMIHTLTPAEEEEEEYDINDETIELFADDDEEDE